MAAFQENLNDAEKLVLYAKVFENKRQRKLRLELRERLGEALNRPKKSRDGLDCIENDIVYLIFHDGNQVGPRDFQDPRPLLRQAIVAACAALETYLADKVMECIPQVMGMNELPKRLGDVPLTVGHWSKIESQYKRRTWGVRPIIEEAVKEQASTSPSRMGQVLGMIGIDKWSRKLDEDRKVPKGTSEKQLKVLTDRRNQIAHAADRVGSGRATLTTDETTEYLEQVKSIAESLEKVIDGAMHQA